MTCMKFFLLKGPLDPELKAQAPGLASATVSVTRGRVVVSHAVSHYRKIP